MKQVFSLNDHDFNIIHSSWPILRDNPELVSTYMQCLLEMFPKLREWENSLEQVDGIVEFLLHKINLLVQNIENPEVFDEIISEYARIWVQNKFAPYQFKIGSLAFIKSLGLLLPVSISEIKIIKVCWIKLSMTIEQELIAQEIALCEAKNNIR